MFLVAENNTFRTMFGIQFILLPLALIFIPGGIASVIKEKIENNVVEAKILGGRKAASGQFPYIVSLEFKGMSSSEEVFHFCGGSIISKKWVITAGHCAEGMEPENMQVRAGSLRRHSGGSVHQISRIIVYPGYDNQRIDNDLALLRVKEPFVFSDTIQRVRLPEQNELVEEGTEVTVAGWGMTGDFSRGSKALKYVELEVMNMWECKYRYLIHEFNMDVTDNMICAIQEGSDSRRGDSGGPLVIPYNNGDELVGVVSWGDDSSVGSAEAPGVYTYVSRFRNYIRRVTGV